MNPSDNELKCSSDSVANSDHSSVKLTKFTCLEPDALGSRQQLSCSCNCLATHHTTNPSTDLGRPTFAQNEPKLATISNKIFSNNLLSNKSSIDISLATNDKRTSESLADQLALAHSRCSSSAEPTSDQQFQIIWRQLSFEVTEISPADNLFRATLSRLSQLWSLKRDPKTSQQRLARPSGGPGQQARQQPSNKSSCTLSSISSDSSAESAARSSNKRVIFENLNGCIRSGEISAILGPSGAGKTSLLNAICGRTDNYRGSIQLLGCGQRRMRLSIIPQKDYLLENLTVRESLLYASKILNPDPSFDHQANIMRVVKTLNLATCFDSSVSQISGGEYKRVSIAQELLIHPDILVLDEPTSGLDSLNCKKLIQSLVQLIEASRTGRINPIAIVMTIHQPDIDVFNMFDHVYCMARKGNVIFDGNPRQAIDTIRNHAQFESNRLPFELARALETGSPVAANPANMLIEIASEDLYGMRPIESLARLQRKQFEQLSQVSSTSLHDNSSTTIEITSSPPPVLSSDTSGPGQAVVLAPEAGRRLSNTSSSTEGQQQQYNSKKVPHLIRDKRLGAKQSRGEGLFWYHTSLLTKRAFLATLRDPLSCLASLLFHLSIPFVMYTVYSKNIGSVKACPMVVRDMDLLSMASNKTLTIVKDLQEQLTVGYECTAMFFVTTYSFSMCSTAVAGLAFPLSMHVLLKELRNGWYGLSPFVTAKTISSIPFEVLFPVTSIVLLYFILEMPSSYLEWRLGGIALTVACIAMIGQTMGLIFGALCMDSVQTAVFLGLASSLPQALLSGYTARVQQMPQFLQKLSWLSPYRYSMDLINMFRFGFGMCPCDDDADAFLRSSKAKFLDVPEQMKPLIAYYLSNSVSESDNPTPPDTTLATNETAPLMLEALTNSSLTQRLAGISYDFILNPTERSSILSQIETREVDLFKRMADQLTRSFSFGREVGNCSTARSQLLITYETPEDDQIGLVFGYLVGLLICVRIILLVIVKFKVGSRL